MPSLGERKGGVAEKEAVWGACPARTRTKWKFIGATCRGLTFGNADTSATRKQEAVEGHLKKLRSRSVLIGNLD